MTEEQEILAKYLAKELRKIAQPVGPLHAFWDIIIDLEEVLIGRKPFIKDMPINELLGDAQKVLDTHTRNRNNATQS